MNKQQSYLAIGFFVVFVIQGFRMYDPTVSLETVLKEVQEKYPKITEENINAVIKLGDKTEGFPDINRKEIIYFFHAAKFDVQNTVTLMVHHYDVRENLPTIFNSKGKDPEKSDLKEASEILSCSILHNDSYETDGLHYIYTHIVDKRPSMFDLEKVSRYFFYLIKCLLVKYGTFNGVVIIINEEGFQVRHFLHLGRYYKLYPHLSKLLHSALPFRLNKIHVLNSSRAVRLLYDAFPNAAEHTVVLYGENSQEVYKHVPKKIMPNDYLNGEGLSYKEQAKKTYALMKELHRQDEPKEEVIY